MPKLSLPTIRPTNHFAPNGAGHRPQSDTITPKRVAVKIKWTGAKSKCDPAKVQQGARGGVYYTNNRGRKTYLKKDSKCRAEFFHKDNAAKIKEIGKIDKKNMIGGLYDKNLRDRRMSKRFPDPLAVTESKKARWAAKGGGVIQY